MLVLHQVYNKLVECFQPGQIGFWLLSKLHWNLEKEKHLNTGLDVFRCFLMWLKHSGNI